MLEGLKQALRLKKKQQSPTRQQSDGVLLSRRKLFAVTIAAALTGCKKDPDPIQTKRPAVNAEKPRESILSIGHNESIPLPSYSIIEGPAIFRPLGIEIPPDLPKRFAEALVTKVFPENVPTDFSTKNDQEKKQIMGDLYFAIRTCLGELSGTQEMIKKLNEVGKNFRDSCDFINQILIQGGYLINTDSKKGSHTVFNIHPIRSQKIVEVNDGDSKYKFPVFKLGKGEINYDKKDYKVSEGLSNSQMTYAMIFDDEVSTTRNRAIEVERHEETHPFIQQKAKEMGKVTSNIDEGRLEFKIPITFKGEKLSFSSEKFSYLQLHELIGVGQELIAAGENNGEALKLRLENFLKIKEGKGGSYILVVRILPIAVLAAMSKLQVEGKMVLDFDLNTLVNDTTGLAWRNLEKVINNPKIVSEISSAAGAIMYKLGMQILTETV